MIVKAIPIYAHKGKSITYYTGYITHPAKVLSETDPSRHDQLSLLPDDTVQDLSITDDGRVIPMYVSGYMVMPDELVARVDYLRAVYKNYHGKACREDGPIAYHVIVSSAPDERISDQEAHSFPCELAHRLGAYPALIASHIRPIWDARSRLWRGLVKHSHMLLSAYPDAPGAIPEKLNLGHHCQRLRELSDQLALERGLQVSVDADHHRSDAYYAVMCGKRGTGWMETARKQLSTAVAEAIDRVDYVARVSDLGWSLQQLGPDFLYISSNGHKVMDHKLGRDFTLARLENRWAARQEGSLDEKLEQSLPKGEQVYISIPLGGRFNDAKSYYRCSLQELAIAYRESSLVSYFRPGCMYALSAENGRVIRRAEGQQLLDYLGVGDAWKKEPTLSLEVRQRRLSWHMQRIRQEAELQCERHANSSWLRYDCLCRRQAREREEYPGAFPEKKPEWRQSLRRRYEEMTIVEMILYLICEALLPDFDSGLWEWVWEPVEPFDTTDISPAVWAMLNTVYVLKTEGICGLFALGKKKAEASQQFEKAAKELLDAQIELEMLEPLWGPAWQCKSAKMAFDTCSARVSSYEELCDTYPAVVAAYDKAVHAARAVCMEHWGGIDRVLHRCYELEQKLPKLQQAMAAEYERMRQCELTYSGLRIDRDRAKLDAEIAEAKRKPSFEDIVASAEQRKSFDRESAKKTPIDRDHR